MKPPDPSTGSRTELPGGSGGGRPAAPPPGGAPGQPALVRRPSLWSRLVRAPLLILGLPLLGVGVGALGRGELLAATLAAAAGLPLLVLGLAPWLQRAVFDAEGIHSRSLLGRTDVAWPGSRAAFVVNAWGNGRSATAAVEVPAGQGSVVRLAAPRVTTASRSTALARAEAEVTEIWEWARARGYVSETVPDLPQEEPAQPRGEPGSRAYAGATADDAGRRAGRSGTAGGAARSTGRREEAVPVDHDLLDQEPLVLRAWPSSCPLVVLCVLAGLLAGGVGTVLVTHPDVRDSGERPNPLMGHGVLTAAVGVLAVVLAVLLLVGAWAQARGRMTVSREGFSYFNGMWTARAPWPTSRSSVFAAALRSRGRTTAMVYVLWPGGAAQPVPGLRWTSTEEEAALLPAARAARTLWAWGASRGLTADDGGYHPAVLESLEQRRVTTARRLAYLVSRSEDPGLG